MRKLFIITALTGALTVLLTAATMAAPSVSLVGFDSNTFTYTYEVTLGAGDTFSQLSIITDNLTEPWEGPFWEYNSSPAGWYGTSTYGPPDGAQWSGDTIATPGTYQFQWMVQDSRPTSSPVTDGAQIWNGTGNFSAYAVAIPTAVPAPEPGSIAAFGLLAASMCTFIRRKIR